MDKSEIVEMEVLCDFFEKLYNLPYNSNDYRRSKIFTCKTFYQEIFGIEPINCYYTPEKLDIIQDFIIQIVMKDITKLCDEYINNFNNAHINDMIDECKQYKKFYLKYHKKN